MQGEGKRGKGKQGEGEQGEGKQDKVKQQRFPFPRCYYPNFFYFFLRVIATFTGKDAWIHLRITVKTAIIHFSHTFEEFLQSRHHFVASE